MKALSFEKAEILPFSSASKHPKSWPWSGEIKSSCRLPCLATTMQLRVRCSFLQQCVPCQTALTYIACRGHKRLPAQVRGVSNPETDVTTVWPKSDSMSSATVETKKKGRKEPKVAQEFSSKHEEHQVRAVSPLEMPSHFSSASHRWHYMKRAIKLNHRVAITGLLICELSPPPQRNPNLPVQWMYTCGHCRALRSRAHVSRGSGPKGWRTSHSTWPHTALFPAAFTQHKMVAGGRRTRWSKSVAHMCCSHYSLSLCTASIFQSYRLGSQETAQCLQQWDQVTKFRVGENY